MQGVGGSENLRKVMTGFMAHTRQFDEPGESVVNQFKIPNILSEVEVIHDLVL